MRLHFRETPWDLYIAIGYTAAIAVVLLELGVGELVAILLILFVPGYVLVAALFPKNTELDWIERVALSVGLSIAVVPLLGLLLNFTPWGIRFVPIICAITLFTLSVGFAAYWRRRRLPGEQRISLTLDLSIPDRQKSTVLDKGLTIGLAASIVVAGCTLAYVVLTPRPGGNFTEFYILGPGGNASGYPTRLNVSQNGIVMIGLANHEYASVNYAVRVDLVGVRIVYNSTAQVNQTLEVNRTTWTWLNVTLTDGANWAHAYPFSISFVGLWKVQFRLYENGGLTNQELHLIIRVT